MNQFEERERLAKEELRTQLQKVRTDWEKKYCGRKQEIIFSNDKLFVKVSATKYRAKTDLVMIGGVIKLLKVYKNKWHTAVEKACVELGVVGFPKLNRGSELHKRALEILATLKATGNNGSD